MVGSVFEGEEGCMSHALCVVSGGVTSTPSDEGFLNDPSSTSGKHQRYASIIHTQPSFHL